MEAPATQLGNQFICDVINLNSIYSWNRAASVALAVFVDILMKISVMLALVDMVNNSFVG